MRPPAPIRCWLLLVLLALPLRPAASIARAGGLVATLVAAAPLPTPTLGVIHRGVISNLYMTRDGNCQSATPRDAQTQFPLGTRTVCIQIDGHLYAGDTLSVSIVDAQGRAAVDFGTYTHASDSPAGVYLTCAYHHNASVDSGAAVDPWPRGTYVTRVAINGGGQLTAGWQVGTGEPAAATPPSVAPTATPQLAAATTTPSPDLPPPGPTATMVPPSPTPDAAVLLDDGFSGNSSSLPLAKGHLYLDGAGYEMVVLQSDPTTQLAEPPQLPAMASFSAAATLNLVQGDKDASYGFELSAGAAHYLIELDGLGRLGIVRPDGGKRIPLRDWAADPAIHRGHATNVLAIDYAGGMVQVRVNNAPIAFLDLPGSAGAVTFGVLNDGGSAGPTQVRCTHLTVWGGPRVALNERFARNGAAWSLGPTYSLGGGALQVDPPKRGDSFAVFPQAIPPVAAFTTLVTLTKASGRDDALVGGMAFLDTAHDGYDFEIDGQGQFFVDRWQDGAWHRLLARSSPSLRTGNATNTLSLRYERGALLLGANGLSLTSLSLAAPPPVGHVGVRVEGGGRVRFTRFILLRPAQTGLDALVPMPRQPATATLLADSFDDNRNGWSQTSGGVSVGGRRLRIAVREKATVYWTYPRGIALGPAYSISATMRLTSVADRGSPYGIVFALDDRRTFLLYGITADGNYDLGWSKGGSWQTDPIPYRTSDAVARDGGANRLRVDVLGGVAQIYLNGLHLGDARLPSGGGHRMGFLTSTGNDLAVSDVRVTALAPPTAPVHVVPPVAPVAPVPSPAVLDSPQQQALRRTQGSIGKITIVSSFGHSKPSFGSGVVILADGTGVYLLTAHHVLRNVNRADASTRLTVQLAGKSVQAVDFSTAPGSLDIALIKLPAMPGLRASVLAGSLHIASLDAVIAAGYPYNPDGGLGQALYPATGAVTIVDAQASLNGVRATYLVHNATLIEGMSGGPLIYARAGAALGQVIGIDVDYLAAGTQGGTSAPGVQGAASPPSPHINPGANVNYAVPAGQIAAVLPGLLAGLHPGPYALPR